MAKTSKTPTKKPSQKSDDQTDPDDKDQDEDEDDDNEDGEDAEEQNRRINAIVTSRVKREMKGVLNQLNTLTDAIGKLSQQPAKKDEDEDTDETDPAPKKTEVDSKLAKKFSKMERELADEKEARKKAEQAQKDEAEKARRQEMVNTFDSALTEHGVTDPKLRRAALITLEQDGYMVRDEESGKIKFKGTDKYQMETYLDPKTGIKQWITTEGKSFVPAVDTGGSGTGGSSVGNSKLSRGEFSKLSPQQKASIELERASMGLPPLEQQ